MPELVLPIDWIGPGTPVEGVGTVPVEQVQPRDYLPLPGDKAEPAPMVPPEIELSEEAKAQLVRYLDIELGMCRMERSERMDTFARLKRKYRTKFPEFPKDWPIANASQLVVPVIKTAVNTLSARIHQTIMAAEPLVSVRTRDPAFQDQAYALEDFSDMYDTEKLGMEQLIDDVVTETIKLGTSIVEVTNRHERRATVTWDVASRQYVKTVQDVFNGPYVWHIPISNFWIRPEYTDPQTAPWCGKEVWLSWSEIKRMALSGELNPEEIRNIYRLPQSEGDVPAAVLEDEKLEDFEPDGRTQYRLFELAVSWDVDGDGIEEEIMVYFHWESRTILRRRYNGFTRGRRPWIAFRYIRIPHRFYGEGLAEALEHLQEEISTIHNQRIDNATIANLRIILVSRLIRGLQPGDRLWSGKIVRVGDVKTDVGTLQLGEIYPSTVTNETISQQYVREVSGISETATGQAQPVSRTTATAQLALLEELNRRFDKIVKGMRASIAEMHRHMIDLFIQQGTGGLAVEWLGDERGQLLEDFLAQPGDYVHQKIKVRVLATKASVNREVEFQSSIAVMNLIVQMGEQMLQMTQSLAPQATGVIAHELVSAIRPVFKKVMQYADAPSADEAISVLTVLERVLPPPESLGGPIGSQVAAEAGAAGQPATGPGGASESGGGPETSGNQPDRTMAALLNALRSGNGAGAGLAVRGSPVRGVAIP